MRNKRRKKRKYVFNPRKLLGNIFKLTEFLLVIYIIGILIAGFCGIDFYV